MKNRILATGPILACWPTVHGLRGPPGLYPGLTVRGGVSSLLGQPAMAAAARQPCRAGSPDGEAADRGRDE
jgi:hypothetical protein